MRRFLFLPLALLLFSSCSNEMAVYTLDGSTHEGSMVIPGEEFASISASATADEGDLELMISRYASRSFYLSMDAADATLIVDGKNVSPKKSKTFIGLSDSKILSADYPSIKKAVAVLPADTLDASLSITSFLNFGNAHDYPEKFSVLLHVQSPAGSKDTTLVFTRKIVHKTMSRPY